jgi:hypothetical protein
VIERLTTDEKDYDLVLSSNHAILGAGSVGSINRPQHSPPNLHLFTKRCYSYGRKRSGTRLDRADRRDSDGLEASETGERFDRWASGGDRRCGGAVGAPDPPASVPVFSRYSSIFDSLVASPANEEERRAVKDPLHRLCSCE